MENGTSLEGLTSKSPDCEFGWVHSLIEAVPAWLINEISLTVSVF